MIWWRRQPLRVTLSLLVVVLTVIGIAASSAIATTSLRGYLIDRVDEQLVAGSRILQRPPAAAPQPPQNEDQTRRPPSLFYLELVRADDGESTVLSVPTTSDTDTPAVPAVTELATLVGRPVTVGSQAGDGAWRMLVTASSDRTAYAVAASSLSGVEATVSRLMFLQVLVGAAVALAAGLIGFVVVRRKLRPLDAMAITAHSIAAGDLSIRVSEKSTSVEVDELARSFNAMVARIEEAFTARRQSEASARASEDRLRTFVADAGHELRTPLTSIRGYAELVSSGAAPDPSAALERIQGEADRMSSIVNGLLLLARFDQEEAPVRTRVDLMAIARHAVERIRIVDPDHRWDLAGDESTVLGDPEALGRALDNLLSNARRYADPGTDVRVRVVRLDTGHARVSVTDDGPGLSPDQADRVFDRMYRTDEARTRVSGGYGLGLAIVRSVIEAHGGSVFVESAEGAGSEFGFVLPLHDTDPETPAQPNANPAD